MVRYHVCRWDIARPLILTRLVPNRKLATPNASPRIGQTVTLSLDVVCALMLPASCGRYSTSERGREAFDYSRPATPRPLLNRKSSAAPPLPPAGRLMRLGHSVITAPLLSTPRLHQTFIPLNTTYLYITVTVTSANTSLRLLSPDYNAQPTSTDRPSPPATRH
jgi:hypothetical protein